MTTDELTNTSNYLTNFIQEVANNPAAKSATTTKPKKAGPAKPLKPVKPPKAFEYKGVDDDTDEESTRD